MLSDSEDDKTQPLQDLSALADGELDAATTLSACAYWRGDASARASWHAYHLIGDVMRSEELAADAARDVGFLRGVAERLAAEPVVLAPQPPVSAAAARPASRWSWMAPAAVAAGFMAVASVLVVTRGTAPAMPAEATLAQSLVGKGGLDNAAFPRSVAAAGAEGAEPMTLVADGQLMRDARLDRYLAAHKQFGGTSALGAPSGFLRAATTQTPDR